MSEPLVNAQRQPLEDDQITPLLGPVRTDTENFNSSRGEEWQKFNILSLDGGGIRGYWSLLALEKLMEFVAVKEEELNDGEALHSFDPEDLPPNVSQIPLTQEETRHIQGLGLSEHPIGKVPPTRRYLPCHYFDQIGGSSTGALIAIMLGRFRMTVPDCIAEYRSLGQQVFGKPRMISTLRFGLGDRTKYKASNLEKVFKDVTKRRNEMPGPSATGRITFPSGRGLCTTFVTTKKRDDNLSSSLYLIRSYDHELTYSPNQSHGPTPGTTMSQSRVNTDQTRTETGFSANTNGARKRSRRRKGMLGINYECAQDFEVWQVARAATAAQFYFEPLEIYHHAAGRKITFTDGGFSHTNNPTWEGKREIEDLYGPNSIGIVVSVGTARKLKEDGGKKPFFSSIPHSTRDFADTMTDPEIVHQEIKREHERSRGMFSYYRLNHPGGLKTDLDEWEPKQGMLNKEGGSKTMADIRRSFYEWATKLDIIQQFQACAEELVACRRRRSKTEEMWARYATGCQFKCRERGCPFGDMYAHRIFKDHLKSQHFYEKEDDLNYEVGECKKYWRYQRGPQDRG